MKSVLFIATAVLILSACQHGADAEQKKVLPGALDLNLGRTIASAPLTRSTSMEAQQARRDRGIPSERDLKCQGWGQCDSTGS